ncbi:MAG: hypothetical protein QF579_06290 [Dehalococcoidia bacterium]|jgi:hypothetical protein|nr:hypothetical protein [Dehalococcoidia bacterium]
MPIETSQQGIRLTPERAELRRFLARKMFPSRMAHGGTMFFLGENP